MSPDLLTAWRRVARDDRGPETITMPRAQLRELIDEIARLQLFEDLWEGAQDDG